ncbi:glycine/D-amino acid oxidase-like deaminating enzyme [Streptomyces sp. SAI-133]|uniref:NAD(P)/FAD-dependent oxidoreductase n=1 Tax=unclassified Streptomyces TaxID=2593676 RepID=UPI0024732AD7|nr:MULTISPECIES: FAD-binding oxidoreductase [unclassified Streptomyces]MDH6554376.1 glycine/D-amino acid oxidase-like deaminating enzyme [Streptomyces sp. SAI-041]MDH6581625.1 glycine/D-amino acid oxidase-like deaminating enzyme [Streptomyces sp. SAI-133]
MTVVDKAGGPGYDSTSASSAIVRFVEVPLSIPYERWAAGKPAAAVPGSDVGRYLPPKPISSDAFFKDPDGELGALFTPGAGYVDDLEPAAANLAQAAVAEGADLRCRCAVTSLERTGSVWSVRVNADELLEARVVVTAAGPWSTAVNNLAGIGDEFAVNIAPMRQEVHHVPLPASLRRIPGGAPIILDLDLGTYPRPDSDHSLLIGGTNPNATNWRGSTSRPRRPTPDLGSKPRPVAAPAGSRTSPSRTGPGTAGVHDVAGDWTPVHDRTDAEDHYVAMGTSGNQFKNAPVIGRPMATLVDGVESGHDHDAQPPV